MKERTYNDVEWERVEITDKDIDGHGTNQVQLLGYAPCAEGGGTVKIHAFGYEPYPYEGNYQDIEIDEVEFIPEEPEPEDGE